MSNEDCKVITLLLILWCVWEASNVTIGKNEKLFQTVGEQEFHLQIRYKQCLLGCMFRQCPAMEHGTPSTWSCTSSLTCDNQNLNCFCNSQNCTACMQPCYKMAGIPQKSTIDWLIHQRDITRVIPSEASFNH